MEDAPSPQLCAVGEEKYTETQSNQYAKQSYASQLARQSYVATKSNLELCPVTIENGIPTIEFTIEEVNTFTKEEGLQQAVVIKFSYGKPEIQELRQILPKQLEVKGNCNIGQLEYRHILVRFDLFEDFANVVSKTTGYVKARGDDFFFRTFPWTMGFNPREETSKAVVWISFPDLPANFFAKKSLMSIAAAVGKPISLDKATKYRTRPSTARVKVLIDLLDNHPQKVKIKIVDTKSGKIIEYDQRIVFDNLPKYCTCCNHQGHDVKSCRWNANEQIDHASQNRHSEDRGKLKKLKGDARDFLNANRAARNKENVFSGLNIAAGGPTELKDVTEKLEHINEDPQICQPVHTVPLVEDVPSENVIPKDNAESVQINEMLVEKQTPPYFAEGVSDLETNRNSDGVIGQSFLKVMEPSVVNNSDLMTELQKNVDNTEGVNKLQTSADTEKQTNAAADLKKKADEKQLNDTEMQTDVAESQTNAIVKQTNFADLKTKFADLQSNAEAQKDQLQTSEAVEIQTNAVVELKNNAAAQKVNDLQTIAADQMELRIPKQSNADADQRTISFDQIVSNQMDQNVDNVLIDNDPSNLNRQTEILHPKNAVLSAEKFLHPSIMTELISEQEMKSANAGIDKQAFVNQNTEMCDVMELEFAASGTKIPNTADRTIFNESVTASKQWHRDRSAFQFDFQEVKKSDKEFPQNQMDTRSTIENFPNCEMDQAKFVKIPTDNTASNSKKYQLEDNKALMSVSNSFDALVNVDEEERKSMGLNTGHSQTTSQNSATKMASHANETNIQSGSIHKGITDHKIPKRAKISKPNLWKDQGDYDDEETWGEGLASFSWEEEDQDSGEDSDDSIEQKIERKIANKNSRVKVKQTAIPNRRLNHNAPVYVPTSNVKSVRSFEGTSTFNNNDHHLKSAEGSVEQFTTMQPSTNLQSNQKLSVDVNIVDISQEKQLATANSVISSEDKQILAQEVSQDLPKISCAGNHIFEDGEEEDFINQCRADAAIKGDLSPMHSTRIKKSHQRERSWDGNTVEVRKPPMRNAKQKQAAQANFPKSNRLKNKS